MATARHSAPRGRRGGRQPVPWLFSAGVSVGSCSEFRLPERRQPSSSGAPASAANRKRKRSRNETAVNSARSGLYAAVSGVEVGVPIVSATSYGSPSHHGPCSRWRHSMRPRSPTGRAQRMRHGHGRSAHAGICEHVRRPATAPMLGFVRSLPPSRCQHLSTSWRLTRCVTVVRDARVLVAKSSDAYMTKAPSLGRP